MTPLLFLDLEFTCWPRGTLVEKCPEIIEIAWVCANPLRSHRAFVRPLDHPRLSQHCLDLLDIQQSSITSADPFEDVWRTTRTMLEKIAPLSHFAVFTWGTKDKEILLDEWRRYHCPPAERFHHNQFVDLEKIYRRMLAVERFVQSPRRISLKAAARMEKITIGSTCHHHALCDAELLHALSLRLPSHIQQAVQQGFPQRREVIRPVSPHAGGAAVPRHESATS